MLGVGRARRRLGLGLVFAAVLLVAADAGMTSSYRRKLEATVEMPLDADVFRVPPGYNAPQQVYITVGDQEGTSMIVSWVTADELGSRIYSTKDYYAMGFGHTVRSFCFTTLPMPGPVPFKFGLIGDLGQTFDSNTTLSHYESNGGDAVLYVGDLSYADNHPLHDRWDTWARFVERSAAHQRWVWTAGNHELDLAPELGEHAPFKRFAHRYPTLRRASPPAAAPPFWYSVRIASSHVVVLPSYSAYGMYTPQWAWLRAELARVDRAATPWLIVLVHSPWYSSNEYHYMEGETMRVQFERWLVAAKADLVVAGDVHAYERSHRVSNVAYDIINGRCMPVRSRDAPVYVTVGGGGNIEGIAH
ncbi:hypothetical protein SETIT_9G332400v2 [Setaria italica]|uniref:Purple acid phosphatase n=1 Tax=Setaria italica TaxID=4555 RepID=A0A368SQ75_SETIT|nr:hypothetical protein SETIT_9G332400v2 [Setaria italica]